MSWAAGVRTAVVTAAGTGTRMWPATAILQKELLPVAGVPAFEFLLWELEEQGFENVIAVTGDAGQGLAKVHSVAIDRGLRDVHLRLVEGIEPLGLGHSVLAAAAETGSAPFALLLGDNIISQSVRLLERLRRVYLEHQPLAVLAVTNVAPELMHLYGCIEPDSQVFRGLSEVLRVRSIIEKPDSGRAPSSLGIIGRYVLSPAIYGELRAQEWDPSREFDLTSSLSRLAQAGVVLAVQVPDCRYDIGDPSNFVEATVGLAVERGRLTSAAASRMIERLHGVIPT